MRRMLLAGTVLLLLLLTSCTGFPSGASPTPTSGVSATPAGGAQSAACQGLGVVSRALTSLAGAGDQATIGQIKTLQSALSAAIAVVEKVMPADSDQSLADLKAANDQLKQSLADLPDSDKLSQHAAQLQQFKAQVARAQAAVTQLTTRLNCSD